MDRRWWQPTAGGAPTDGERNRGLVADGGEDGDADDTEPPADGDGAETSADPSGLDRSNVEVTDAGEAEPTDPKWDKPDLDDIPEFETGAAEPLADSGRDEHDAADPTSGMPNTARSPGDSRIKREGTEGYVAALELCARLPEDVQLPEQAADLVPAAVEAELEKDVQSFAAAEFDNPSPHVDALEFVERDGDIWLRLRLGIPREAFADLDPAEVRSHALQELEGIL